MSARELVTWKRLAHRFPLFPCCERLGCTKMAAFQIRDNTSLANGHLRCSDHRSGAKEVPILGGAQ